MSERDILNNTPGFWATIQDSPSPSYGYTRKTNANALLSRTRMGAWSQRDNANAGYSIVMSYLGRPWSTMLYLKQFYEIGKRGYFTYIDYDGGGRHHVGRFTTEPNPVEVANGVFNCQNLIFEEIPQARMVTYPNDFANWGATINVIDDTLRLQPSYAGTWTLRQHPGLVAPTDYPPSYELNNATPTVNDFAQVQYVGWGFQMTFPLRSTAGQCNVLLDGQVLVQALDLCTGACAAAANYSMINPLAPYVSVTLPTPGGPSFNVVAGVSVTISMPYVPLDVHRVKIAPLVTKSGSSTGYEVSFPAVQVIV